MAFTENLDAFLSTDDFAVVCTLGASSFNGILESPHVQALDMGGAQPVLHMKYSSVSAATNGTAITVGGTSYIIRSVAPDGTGMAAVTLELAA